MDEITAESLYAQVRRQGQVSVDGSHSHLVPKIRRLAKKDGLIFGTHTTRLGKRGHVGWNRTSVALFVHDGHGNLVFPDATAGPSSE